MPDVISCKMYEFSSLTVPPRAGHDDKKEGVALTPVLKGTAGKKNHFLACLVFSVCCVVLNFALRNLAALIGVPLYLDSVGTILAGALGGYLPGVLVGYFFVLPVCLQFFINYSVSDSIVNTITLGSYMSLFLSMVVLIGIVFEFPTVVVVLSRIGVLSRTTLRKGRKYALVVILVLAALITPSDPFSMLVLAVPLYLLYEISILCASDNSEQDAD